MKIQILKIGSKSGNIVADAAMINRMAKAYNPAHHEAPLFIGPCGDTIPAVGWVSSLSQAGDSLYAEFRQMDSQIEKDLMACKRQVKIVGFYPDYSLRHISLTGEPIFVYGPQNKFEENLNYFEFIEGGDEMSLVNDPRMNAFLRLGDEIMTGKQSKQFSEKNNPGEALHQKTMDIFSNQKCFTENECSDGKKMDYAAAFHEACRQNPDLTAQYINQMEEAKKQNMTPTLFRQGRIKK